MIDSSEIQFQGSECGDQSKENLGFFFRGSCYFSLVIWRYLGIDFRVVQCF